MNDAVNDTCSICLFRKGVAKYCTHLYCDECLKNLCLFRLQHHQKCGCAIPGCIEYDQKQIDAILDNESKTTQIEAYLRQHGQKCTKCHEWVTKGDGCNFVNCRCGLSWDWRHGPPDFVNQTSPSSWCFRWFRDDTKILLGQLSTTTLKMIEQELTFHTSNSREYSTRNILNHLKKL